MITELSIRNLKHRMENLSQWAMYKDGIGKLHIESFIKELSEIEDNASDEIATLRAQLAEAREALELLSQYKNYVEDGEVKTDTYGIVHVSDFAKYYLDKLNKVITA